MAQVPASPEQLYNRVANDLRMPTVAEWDTFPFDGNDILPEVIWKENIAIVVRELANSPGSAPPA